MTLDGPSVLVGVVGAGVLAWIVLWALFGKGQRPGQATTFERLFYICVVGLVGYALAGNEGAVGGVILGFLTPWLAPDPHARGRRSSSGKDILKAGIALALLGGGLMWLSFYLWP